MDKLKQIPGFLPEDYDKEPPGIEDMDLDECQINWLKHDQKVEEDGIALGVQMSSEYDSYIVIGFNKEKLLKNGLTKHDFVCGACHVDGGDYDAVSEMARQLGYFTYKNIEVYKILKKALAWQQALQDEEDNPEPLVHDYLPRDQRFHQNRYHRILTEEFENVQEDFYKALGNYKLRRDIQMQMVLTAIADQLNENEPVEIDFFCNFVLGEHSVGDNVSGIDVTLRPYPCTLEEAAQKRDRYVELCSLYNVPCHIEWLEDRPTR